MKMRMKEFLLNESERLGILPESVHMRINRGKYRHKIAIRRKNARVVFVEHVEKPFLKKCERVSK